MIRGALIRLSRRLLPALAGAALAALAACLPKGLPPDEPDLPLPETSGPVELVVGGSCGGDCGSAAGTGLVPSPFCGGGCWCSYSTWDGDSHEWKGTCAPPPRCSDGIDNEADGLIDFGNDPECVSAYDNAEGPP